MRFAAFLLMAALCLCPAAQAQTEDNGFAVMELFTTRACSDAPPVDARVKKIVDEADENLIALGCHISYLNRAAPPAGSISEATIPNYNDLLSLAACDLRHTAYWSAHVTSSLYMPQIVINGRFDTIGSTEQVITSGIAMARQHMPLQTIPLRIRNNILEVTLNKMPVKQPVNIWLFAYNTIHSEKGAAGLEPDAIIDYVNYVSFISRLLIWDGTYRNMSFPLTGIEAEGYAVIAQYEDFTDIIAAGKIERD